MFPHPFCSSHPRDSAEHKDSWKWELRLSIKSKWKMIGCCCIICNILEYPDEDYSPTIGGVPGNTIRMKEISENWLLCKIKGQGFKYQKSVRIHFIYIATHPEESKCEFRSRAISCCLVWCHDRSMSLRYARILLHIFWQTIKIENSCKLN